MNPDDKLNPATMRIVAEKSIGLLDRRCIRLNGRDLNWRALFDTRADNVFLVKMSYWFSP